MLAFYFQDSYSNTDLSGIKCFILLFKLHFKFQFLMKWFFLALTSVMDLNSVDSATFREYWACILFFSLFLIEVISVCNVTEVLCIQHFISASVVEEAARYQNLSFHPSPYSWCLPAFPSGKPCSALCICVLVWFGLFIYFGLLFLSYILHVSEIIWYLSLTYSITPSSSTHVAADGKI